jgi:hypothetical protein
MATRVLWLFVSVLFTLMTGWSSLQVWRAAGAKSWPVTEGMVIAFYGAPDFKYSVNGQTYTNSYVSCNELFAGLYSTGDSAKQAVRYPLNGKVAVRYCPSAPSVAVLETRFNLRAGLLQIAVLIVVSLVSLAGFVFGRSIRGHLPA